MHPKIMPLRYSQQTKLEQEGKKSKQKEEEEKNDEHQQRKQVVGNVGHPLV